LNEALNIAINAAKESLRASYVVWDLVETHGDNGGTVQVDNLTVTISASVPDGVSRAAMAYFQVADASEDNRPFIIKLTGENVRHARRILNGEENARVHVQGTIVKSAVDYNPGWSFHLDASTIGFFEMAIEVCDATMVYVEQHLDEVGGSTLPDCHWCPWSSRIIAEIPAE
jgi:hypothetical protein